MPGYRVTGMPIVPVSPTVSLNQAARRSGEVNVAKVLPSGRIGQRRPR
jgi:hypothetical protein